MSKNITHRDFLKIIFLINNPLLIILSVVFPDFSAYLNQKFYIDNLVSEFYALSVVFPDFEAYQ